MVRKSCDLWIFYNMATTIHETIVAGLVGSAVVERLTTAETVTSVAALVTTETNREWHIESVCSKSIQKRSLQIVLPDGKVLSYTTIVPAVPPVTVIVLRSPAPVLHTVVVAL